VKELSGRIAVVTGAASGIGRALASSFVAAGMSVVLADVEQEPLDLAVRELRDTGGQVLGVPTDVSRLDQVEALAEETMSRFGAVHVVCNNAGVGSGAALAEIPLEVWQWVMGVNFWGVLYGCQVFLPLLRRQPEGHIVNTASVAALCGEAPTTAPYVASKAAVLGLSEVLQRELEDAGEPIGVSVLLPGPVNTNIPTSEDVVKLVHFLRRAPGVGREQFASIWRGEYAAAVTDATRDAKGLVRKYVQNPTLGLEGSVFEGSAYAQGVFGSYGGIEEFFFASRADFDAFTQDAGTRELLRERGAGIVDAGGSFSMVVTDRLRFTSALSPDGSSVYCWAPPGLEVRSIPGVWSGPVA
jgi:NAD(P)-dependent dehydrogenase (short-subunit alcohol dehydrogenase family)